MVCRMCGLLRSDWDAVPNRYVGPFKRNRRESSNIHSAWGVREGSVVLHSIASTVQAHTHVHGVFFLHKFQYAIPALSVTGRAMRVAERDSITNNGFSSSCPRINSFTSSSRHRSQNFSLWFRVMNTQATSQSEGHLASQPRTASWVAHFSNVAGAACHADSVQATEILITQLDIAARDCASQLPLNGLYPLQMGLLQCPRSLSIW